VYAYRAELLRAGSGSPHAARLERAGGERTVADLGAWLLQGRIGPGLKAADHV